MVFIFKHFDFFERLSMLLACKCALDDIPIYLVHVMKCSIGLPIYWVVALRKRQLMFVRKALETGTFAQLFAQLSSLAFQ